MARVAVLIDRSPACPEWKGGIAWALINALAESQHDVQVFTPLASEEIGPTHARVAVARPAGRFRITTLPAWTRALIMHQPDVVHTFAPRESKFSCWPLLEAIGPALPRARRVATIFEEADLEGSAAWWLASHPRWVTFDANVVFNSGFKGEVDLVGLGRFAPNVAPSGEGLDILVPAPVGEWQDPRESFTALARFLREDPTRVVRIVGGWGGLHLSERRHAWDALGELAARVKLSGPLSLEDFAREASVARGLWRASLKPGSWRARIAALVDGGSGAADGDDDVVNRLSRIYSAPGRW